MNSKGTHALGKGDRPVKDVSTKYGGAQRKFYLWVPSELKPSFPLLCWSRVWQPVISAFLCTGGPSPSDSLLA